MILLLLQSIIVSNDIPHGMIFSAMIVVSIMLLHFREIATVLEGMINMIKSKVCVNKASK